MKERSKRNLTIRILCCLLVFMGVGFAAMINQIYISKNQADFETGVNYASDWYYKEYTTIQFMQ